MKKQKANPDDPFSKIAEVIGEVLGAALALDLLKAMAEEIFNPTTDEDENESIDLKA